MLPPTAWLRRALLQPYQKLPAADTPVSYQPSETPAFWWINPILTTASKRPLHGQREGRTETAGSQGNTDHRFRSECMVGAVREENVRAEVEQEAGHKQVARLSPQGRAANTNHRGGFFCRLQTLWLC